MYKKQGKIALTRPDVEKKGRKTYHTIDFVHSKADIGRLESSGHHRVHQAIQIHIPFEIETTKESYRSDVSISKVYSTFSVFSFVPTHCLGS